jgi:RNA polymerase beta subunit
MDPLHPPNLCPRTTRPVWGQVRASPLGSCLLAGVPSPPNDEVEEEGAATAANDNDGVSWHRWRKEYLRPIKFPVEGFDHVHGQSVIDEIDNHPLGSAGGADGGSFPRVDEEDGDDNDAESKKSAPSVQQHVHDYGSTKTPDDAPVGSLREKWRLLPHFLRLRSLLRQHIDSFDHFVGTEMREIVQSPSAREIRSDHDPNFYLRYEHCWVGEPSIDEDSYSVVAATPFQCRLRDVTYSAPIYVNVRYTRGRQMVVKRKVIIGRMPIMLRSKNCVLRNRSEDELAALKECPYGACVFLAAAATCFWCWFVLQCWCNIYVVYVPVVNVNSIGIVNSKLFCLLCEV